MFEPSALIAYLLASIAIILAPGPAQALVLTRSVSEGKRAGILTAIGLNVGTLFHAVAAALGLSAILATSALAFAIVKYLGAAYLVYLGIRAWMNKENETGSEATDGKGSRQVLGKAILTGVLNPKVALFFLAFLPQFIDPTRGSALIQFLMLGGLLALLDVIYETGLVLVADTMSGWIRANPSFALWRQRVTSIVLVGLGVRLALTTRE